MKNNGLLALFLLLAFPLSAQEAPIKAEVLLQKSINYHDPQGSWGETALRWRFYESRPDNSYRLSDMYWQPLQDRFELTQQVGRDQLYRLVDQGNCVSKVNGSAMISEAQQKQYRLTCERNTMYRNYYTYLWGLPMKLEDPGTLIDPTVEKKDFFGQELLAMRVQYAEGIGEDTWYFYFDPVTYALKGYRFYHDESKNDGEYILLEGEVALDGMRIPAKRTWYKHQDGKLLGTDELVPMQWK